MQPVGLLEAHQDPFDRAAQQHDQREHDIHDADLLVIDADQPFREHRRPEPEIGEQREGDDGADDDEPGGAGKDDVVHARVEEDVQEVERVDIETAEHRAPEAICHLGNPYLLATRRL